MSTHTLTKEQTTQAALFFQATFIGIITAAKIENKLLPEIKGSNKYKNNFKGVKKYVKRLEENLAEYRRRVFGGQKVAENCAAYLDIAERHLAYNELVTEFTIKNQFHFYSVSNTDTAALCLQTWLFCALSMIIIEDSGNERLANHLGVYGTNTGINAIMKYIETISQCLDITVPAAQDLKQVTDAFHVFEDKFLKNEELLLEIVQVNGITLIQQ